MKKTTVKLDLKVLCAYKANEIEEFINDGTFSKWLQESADEFEGGNLEATVKVLKHNISSKITNTNKSINAGNYNPHAKEQLKVTELIKAYCNTLLNYNPSEKPQSKYTLEDISNIADYATAQKVYDSICSVKRDTKVTSDVNPDAYNDACERFDAASKKRKELMVKPVLTNEQIDAIKSLGLTKKNVQKLFDIIGK